MIKLLREIASDSLDIAKHSYHQYKMTGTSDAAIAARKLQAAKDILQDAKLKAISEEKVLLETRERALQELAELQAKALAKGLNPLNSNFPEQEPPSEKIN